LNKKWEKSYYFTLNGIGEVFIGSTQISNELPITQVVDSVQVSYDNASETLIGLSTFKNKSVAK